MNIVDFLFEHSHKLSKKLVLGNSESIGYDEIYRNIVILAAYLRENHHENNNILLIGNNSVYFVIAYFAIMKSGNTCIPVDPGAVTNAKYLDHIIDISQPAAIILDKRIPINLGDTKIELINEETAIRIIHQSSNDEFISCEEFDGSRIAEIIFTSGSTALPKGVMISHDNLIANTSSIIDYLKLTGDDTIEVVLPFFYCYGLSLLHTHARVGGSLVLNNTFFFLNSVISDIENYQCTGFAGVPSHFQMLLRKSPDFRRRKFPSLRYVTQAGGKLPNAFIHEFAELFPDVDFFVMYGQTEATARLSYLPPEKLSEKPGSIGKGIPGVTLEVIDKNGNEVQPGEIGEIVASGKNIMAGYYKDNETTLRTIREGKLYTGDLATVDKDGYIYIVARDKEFIKVGGERVSPKEIEEVITELPEVVDCLITRIEDDILGEAICAYVVLNNKKVTEKDIRIFCMNRLSLNKVPKNIIIVDRIRTNSVGKKIVSI